VNDGYEFAYTSAVVAEHGSGTVLLSNSLPVRAEAYSADTTRAYVEGLLPEGAERERIAAELAVDPGDGYALIEILGRDCAGAVSFHPQGGEPEAGPAGGSLPRIALSGDRCKIGMVRDGIEGAWEVPPTGMPSTHIVKPETGELPEIVTNEMFCTAVFRQSGLLAAKSSIEAIDGRPCLVSPRFDLVWDGRKPRRLHQETFCQALGIAPPGLAAGGEDEDAPGFAEASGLLRAIGLKAEIPTLVHAAFGNYVLGNGDAHGKNFALLFRDGEVRLAPFYDVTSTVVYDASLEAGMVLPDDFDLTTYLLGLRRVAEECGTDFDVFHIQASCALKYVCDAIEVVAERAEEEGWHAPVIDRIFEVAQDRAGRCAERLLRWNSLDM